MEIKIFNDELRCKLLKVCEEHGIGWEYTDKHEEIYTVTKMGDRLVISLRSDSEFIRGTHVALRDL